MPLVLEAMLASCARRQLANAKSEECSTEPDSCGPRYEHGGEEMTLVLPESPPDVTLARAEAIRYAIGQLRVS